MALEVSKGSCGAGCVAHLGIRASPDACWAELRLAVKQEEESMIGPKGIVLGSRRCCSAPPCPHKRVHPVVILLKIVKTCGGTAGIVGRIVRISEETNATCVKTGAICARTPGISRRTGGIFRGMNRISGRIGVSSNRMNAQEPLPPNSNRIARTCGGTDRISEVIGATCGRTCGIDERIVETCKRTGGMFGTISAMCEKIGKIAGKIGGISDPIAPSVPVGADRAFAPVCTIGAKVRARGRVTKLYFWKHV